MLLCSIDCDFVLSPQGGLQGATLFFAPALWLKKPAVPNAICRFCPQGGWQGATLFFDLALWLKKPAVPNAICRFCPQSGLQNVALCYIMILC